MGARSKNLKPVVIGVTGVIGSGKSTVCRLLQDKQNFIWIETDKIAHELYLPDRPGYKKIQDYFGSSFVGPKGVHRGRLLQLVSKSPQKIWILNQLMHPVIFQEVNKKIVQLNSLHEGEKPLLICLEGVYFEASDLGRFVDHIFVIDAPEKIVLERLKTRKIPQKYLHVLYKFQRRNIPQNGIVIQNDGTKEELDKKVADTLLTVLK